MAKKLVYEVILQQYIFETLVFGSSNDRLDLLPPFLAHKVKDIRIVIPEVPLTGHVTDFKIIFQDGKSVNVEVKWKTSQFNHNIKYYQNKSGYILVLYNDLLDLKSRSSNRYNELLTTDIVVVDNEIFKEWFIKNSYKFISSTLAAYHPDIRVRSPKYWVIYVSKGKNQSHYFNQALQRGLWAFRFGKNLLNVMDIMKDDYVIFIARNSQKKARQIYAGDKDWNFGHVGIYKVTKDYYCTWQEDCFEDASLPRPVPLNQKEFMHFFDFKRQRNSLSLVADYGSADTQGFMFRGNDFKTGPEDTEFCDALRSSNTQSGSPMPISQGTFNYIRHLFAQKIANL